MERPVPDINWEVVPDTLDEISKYIFTSKYARYLEDKKRRETWEETVSRVEEMHLRKYDFLSDEDKDQVRQAFDLVRSKVVVPSMRSMQFGGKAIEAHNARMFNCAVRHIDSIRSFSECFYLLLCGCGVGFGITDKYLNRLPNLVNENSKTGTVITYVVEDNIEGWADSLEALLMCYFENTAYSGRKIVFDYSKIRPEGAILKTGGGRAPGYKGLKQAHQKIKALLDRIIEENHQTRLRTIDAYDILMHTSDAVLSGGIRRSATAVIFNKDDKDMLNAKVGNWFEENPQRARSNNSVLINRNTIEFDEFNDIFERTRQWGEPGFVFADNEDMLFNPCFEVGFIPVTDDGVCGVQFCNLTSINGSKITDSGDYYDAAWAAALIGTLQAGFTHFPYLSNTAQALTEEEALLGVSITGMLENPDVLLDPYSQQMAAGFVKATNKIWAEKIGINQAARTTVIKPEGSSSLALGTMLSGIHGAHDRYMFRRVTANVNESPFQWFKMHNPHMVEKSQWSATGTDEIITFPVKVPDTAILKGDITALQHLDIIKSTQQNWVVPGTNNDINKKGIHHNVSCTVIVKPEEWDDVVRFMYDNKTYFAAVSFIADSGDKDYVQAPNEGIATIEDAQKFKDLINNMLPVDYTGLVEDEDGTSLMQEFACAGNQCEVR